MMFDCPVCHEKHIVPDNYDNTEFICQRGKTFQDMVPEDQLEKTMFNLNTRSTKVDENRSATVIVKGPAYRRDGHPIGILIGKNY